MAVRVVVWLVLAGSLPAQVPGFEFTEQNFRSFAWEFLEPQYREKIWAEKTEFLQLLATVMEAEASLKLLVDKKHPLPPNYVPDDLVTLAQYPTLKVVRRGLQLRRQLLPALLEMNAAAAAAGVTLRLASGYRSFPYQDEVFRRYARRDGIEAASRYSARAGQSQHQLGLAIDFAPISPAFANTAAGKWLSRYALDYGFSLSYPAGQEASTGYIHEPWHFRYVGRPIAALISRYFGGSQQKFFLFWRKAELKRLWE